MSNKPTPEPKLPEHDPEFNFGFRFSREYLDWIKNHKNLPDEVTGAVQLDIIEAVANAEH